MKRYRLRKNEELIIRNTLREKGKIVNIITCYRNDIGQIFIHNANGIEQKVCPYLRYSPNGFWCLKYYNRYRVVNTNEWAWELTRGGYWMAHNPNHLRCDEIGADPLSYKQCEWYNKIAMHKESEG